MDTVFRIENATSAWPGGEVVFRGFNWTVREGETWALAGPVGSGKTALTELLLGRLRLQEGRIAWPLLERLRAAGRPVAWPSEVIARVSFKEESHLFSYSRHYYQQRFNFIEPRDDLTLDAFLRAASSKAETDLATVAAALEIEPLRPLSLIKLSNGQIRRALIARALLSRPELLILDDPFLGLDAAGRKEVADLVGGLVGRGARVLLIARPDALPAWVTHVLELAKPQAMAEARRAAADSHPAAPGRDLRWRLKTPIIELRNVNVTYGDRAILRDVTWTVREGERWAVVGPNGSGKTTLLSLLCGDHPQAYGNDLWLFGQKRGSGESIWDIKRRVGLVSPELHLYFSEPLTAAETVATGFFDVLAYRPTTVEQAATIREFFNYFGITALAGRLFARLSTGEQRLVLLIRALVKRPPLLILDEPFQGLDDRLIGRVQDWLENELRPEQTLLFVSHYPAEIPRTVTRRLRLDQGRATIES